MKEQAVFNQLSDYLFWDTSKENVDIIKHKAFIIKRVLEYGSFEDWKLLLQLYTLNEIVESVKEFKTLDKKALSFIAIISSTPKEQFQCYNTKLSQQAHLDF